MTEQEKPYNVYADIGVANPEEMLRKARIVTEISLVLSRSTDGITNAAAVLGLSEARLNELCADNSMTARKRI